MAYQELIPFVQLAARVRERPDFFERFDKLVISFSGGKDSTATLLWALEKFPRERIDAVFLDSGAEWPETYEHVDYVEDKLALHIVRVSPPKTLFELIEARGKWPGARFRWCTRELKTKPLRRYLLANYSYPLVLFGQRWDESRARSKLPFLTPHMERLGYPVLRPALDWSENKVWAIQRRFGLRTNRVYDYTDRASCWCCVLAPFAELVKFGQLHTEELRRRAHWEQELGHYWRSARLSLARALAIVDDSHDADEAR